MYKIPLNIGTIAGLVGFGLFMFMYFIGISPLHIGRFVGCWVPVAAILWAGFKVRKEVLGGYMTYFQGFQTGTLVTLTWCTLKAFCIYIFMTLDSNNQVVEQLISFQERLEELNEMMGGQKVNSPSSAEIRETYTNGNIMFNDISVNSMFGLMCSGIIAFITKRVPLSGPPK